MSIATFNARTPLTVALAAALGATGLVSTAPASQAATAPVRVAAIDSGTGTPVTTWTSDAGYTRTGWNHTTPASISTTGVADAAAAGVYSTERVGRSFSYSSRALQPSHSYLVRLHFVEQTYDARGKRVFNVTANGQPALSNFDVFAAAGARNKAVVRDISVKTGATGTLNLNFAAVRDYAEVAGLEVFDLAPGTTTTPAPAPVPAPASNNGMGISVTGLDSNTKTDAQREQDMTDVAATGAHYIRMDIPMATVVDAVTCQYNWTRIDAAVDAAQRHNLKVLGIITTLPAKNTWTTSGDCPGATTTDWKGAPTTDAQRQAFATFAAAAATRYKGKAIAYEIWNEPNLTGFWNNPNATAYANLLKKTYPAIKNADPNATVVTGGLGGGTGIPADIPQADYITTMYNAGAQGYFDAIGVHPYTDLNMGGLMPDAHQVRTIMNNHGDTTKQLWGTETGAPTGGAYPLNETDQATLATKTYDHWRTQMPNHGPLFWYTLHDYSAPSLTDTRENHFGILRYDGTRKPVFTTLLQASYGQ